MRILLSTLSAALLIASACDSDDKSAPNPDEAKKAQEAEEDQRVEKRRMEREAKAAAEKQAEEDKKKRLDEICVVPTEGAPPKNLTVACEEVVKAQAAFIERAYADEPTSLEKLKKSAPMQATMTTQMCLAGTMDSARCQKNALDKAPVELRKDLNEFMRICAEKYGQPNKGAAAVPPKPG